MPSSMAGNDYALALPGPSANGIAVIYMLPVKENAQVTAMIRFRNGTMAADPPVTITVSKFLFQGKHVNVM